MKRTESATVCTYDIDANGNLRPSSAIRFMNECTAKQMNETGPDERMLHNLGKVFFVSRYSLGIYGKVKAFDEITVESFPSESKGYSFTRCGRIYKNGTVIAEMNSVWALVDAETKKLCSVSDLQIDFDTEEQISLEVPSRINISKDQPMSLVGEKTVRFSEIDKNNHLNNAEYPNILCNFIPNFNKKCALSCTVNFIRELPFGETVKVYCGSREEDVYYLRLVKKNGDVATEARIVTEDI